MRRQLPPEVSSLLNHFSRELKQCWFCRQLLEGRDETNVHHVFPQNFFPGKEGNKSGVRVHNACHDRFHREHPELRKGTEDKYIERAQKLGDGFGLGIYQPARPRHSVKK